MTRRCSHCSSNGHNSRTCPTRGGGGLKLFGVRIAEAGSMKKSASLGCLSHYATSSSSTSAAYAETNPGDTSPVGDRGNNVETGAADGGYVSDDPTHASCSSNCRSDRKKGIPWTEEEHRMFLVGLQKLGKGDWRGIARNYVVSRTPTQVASHAQKYFIRQTNTTRRKRRSSLFDMVPDMPPDKASMMEEQFLLLAGPEHSTLAEPEKDTLPSLHLTLEHEPIELGTDKSVVELQENNPCSSVEPMVSAFHSAFIPVAFAFWSPNVSVRAEDQLMREGPEVLRPTPVLPKKPIHVDELVGMSELSLTKANSDGMVPSSLSFKLVEASSSRQSAFHSNPAVIASDFSLSNKNAVHAL